MPNSAVRSYFKSILISKVSHESVFNHCWHRRSWIFRSHWNLPTTQRGLRASVAQICSFGVPSLKRLNLILRQFSSCPVLVIMCQIPSWNWNWWPEKKLASYVLRIRTSLEMFSISTDTVHIVLITVMVEFCVCNKDGNRLFKKCGTSSAFMQSTATEINRLSMPAMRADSYPIDVTLHGLVVF